MNTYKGHITTLKDNEVFVFGANLQGFHGAGSAGYASFGVAGNQWRKFQYDKKPTGWKGKWNVKGKTGFQVGEEGKSYALITVTKCGAKRSISRYQFIKNIMALYSCCDIFSDFTFYLAQEGKMGLNGYEPFELAEFFVKAGPIPPNLHLEESFAKFLREELT